MTEIRSTFECHACGAVDVPLWTIGDQDLCSKHVTGSLQWPGHGTPGSQGIVIDRLREKLAESQADVRKYRGIANALAAKLAAKSHLRGLRKRGR